MSVGCPGVSGGVDLVLFDLGGVLVELAGVATMRELAGLGDDQELWTRWLSCPWVSRFERGECSAPEFASGVVSDWALGIPPAEFLDLFGAWPVAPFDGAEDLVESVRAVATVGCLSNTNAMHWDSHFSRWPLLKAFDEVFLSYRLGLVKPDPAIFERVAQMQSLDPARILFLDDNTINTDAARRSGFRAHRVEGPAEARVALAEEGVLPSGR